MFLVPPIPSHQVIFQSVNTVVIFFLAPASTAPSNDPFGDGFGAFGSQPAGGAQADPFAPREAQKPPEPTPSYTYEPSTQNDEPDYGSTATDNSHGGYGGGDSTLSSTMAAGKKGGIFGGKGKVNDPFMMGPSPGPSTEELATIENNGGVVRWSGSNEPFAITVKVINSGFRIIQIFMVREIDY